MQEVSLSKRSSVETSFSSDLEAVMTVSIRAKTSSFHSI